MTTTLQQQDVLSQLAADLDGIGHLVGGRVVREATSFDVVAPWSGAILAECPEASPELLDEAMASARAALPAWRADLEQRRRALIDIAERLEGAEERLGRVISAETGKPAPIGRGEVRLAAAHARWYAGAELPVDTLVDSPELSVQVVRDPVGVVAAIVPWNGPVVMLLNKISAALLVGDTVVAKPSPFTPFSALLVGDLIRDLVPAGVVNILAGGDDIGVAMTKHRQTDMIAFTGSIEAGRAIMAAAAPTLKRVLLELGGNDAAIVMPDVDVQAIAPHLYRGAFGLSGQICAAIKRLYVHEDVHDEVVAALAEIARAAQPGDPWDPGTTMGPSTTRPQFERVTELIEDALAAGGTAVTGGAPLDRPGFFIPPTIVTGVGPGVRLVDEEQFGPALPVIRFSDVDRAIDEVNFSDYGLGGSVWTADLERGTELARRLESGGAWVNRHPHVGAEIPFGGAKQSGVGREGGRLGIDAFCELKTVTIDRSVM
ncbi:aldehyde dehydrogenase family protein [Microbacterium album]|uniref:Aldehyde dehydrogenase n=1 Tax=Microbacterium album TaxID=2053191 RepID=A0A917IDC6_9MICO|nr:aldehyde dehydrogenase family protein [Microbacterium album]GGH36966.1 aldehyde dehydrogenase [Microbacterium album]